MAPGRSRSPVARRSQSTFSNESGENARNLRPRQSNIPERRSSRGQENKPRGSFHRSETSTQDTSSSSIPSGRHDVSVYKEMAALESLQNRGTVIEMDANNFTMEYARRTGLKKPILFTGQLVELGMKIPNVDLNQLLKELSPGQKADVYNHYTEEQKVMSVSTVVQEFIKPSNQSRKGPLSFSLECTESELGRSIQAPNVVRQLDWAQTIFPKAEFMHRDLSYVEKYLTMAMSGSFADFHIEFTGTNSWLHITHGHQFVFLIPPTQANIFRVEHWHTLTDEEQDNTFLQYWTPNCTCVRMDPGQTLLIPSGWINAIFSPVDCIMYGGNFLHEYSLEMQMRICESDQRIQDRGEYMYTCYEQVLWYYVADLVRKVTGRRYVRLIHSDEYKKWCRLRPAERQQLCFDIELKEPEFYDLIQTEPIQTTFDAVDSFPNAPPTQFTDYDTGITYASGYNDDFLKQIRPELRYNLKNLLNAFQSQLDSNKLLVAEGIRRPNHLFADFKRIVDRFSQLPYVEIIKKEEPMSSPCRTRSEHNDSSAFNQEIPSINGDFMETNLIPLAQTSEQELGATTNNFRRLFKLHKRGHYDCLFVVGDAEFPVFKNVLMCQSRVFEQKLAFDGSVSRILFENFSVDAIKEFIEWLYMGQSSNFNDFVEPLFALSVEYRIRKLKFECIQQLIATLNNFTLCQYLILAYMHPDDAFKLPVIEYARQVPKLSLFLLKSTYWQEFSLRNNDLANSIVDEIMGES